METCRAVILHEFGLLTDGQTFYLSPYALSICLAIGGTIRNCITVALTVCLAPAALDSSFDACRRGRVGAGSESF